MKTQNNLKSFSEVMFNKIIYKLLIILTIAYMPIALTYAAYEDCEAVKAPYIENNLCKIEVKNCKENGVTMQVPEGVKLVARCDIEHALCPASPNAECNPYGCPTDPNECANDDETDGVANYTDTAPVVLASNDNERQEDKIHSCEKVGETTIQDHRCRMGLTGCKRGNLDAIPPGHTATAICSIQVGACNRRNPPSCIANCPTDPNECANDDADNNNNNNYTSVEDVLGGFFYTPEHLERRNRNRSRGSQQRGGTGVN